MKIKLISSSIKESSIFEEKEKSYFKESQKILFLDHDQTNDDKIISSNITNIDFKNYLKGIFLI